MEPVSVIFDFSNIAYMSFFRTVTALRLKSEEIRNPFDAHVGSFVNKVQECLEGVYWSETIYAMEGRSRKHSIYPEYKAKRKTKTLQVDPKEALYNLLRNWRSQIIWHPDEEADDTIASYVAQNYDKNFVIYTTDRDLWQLLDHDNVSIYDPMKKEKVTKEHVYKSFDLTEPSKIKLHKTFWGDTSDNIPNAVPRMQKYLIPILEACDGTMEDALLRMKEDASLSRRCNELIASAQETLAINFQLASLSFCAKVQQIGIDEWLKMAEEKKARQAAHQAIEALHE